jgi:serine/threonine protein phosphatase PrpC
VRPNNEDAWRIDPELGAFAIADGMGGHAAGELASRVAIDAVFRALGDRESVAVMDAYVKGSTIEARRAVFDQIRRAINTAHAAVRKEAEGSPTRKGMGCTLDVGVLLGTEGFVAHVGDSRVYVARQTTTIQLTSDHTLAGVLVARGLATPSQPPGGSHALMNAIGRDGKLVVDEIFVDLAQGDRLVLCSDGVHTEIKDENIIAKLARRGAPEDAALGLVNAALARGGNDNATALVVDIGQRRISRGVYDGGLDARDSSYVRHSALFKGVDDEHVDRALSAAVEMQFEPGADLPRFSAEDRVGYIVLDGTVVTPDGWSLGPSAIVYPESLVGAGRGSAMCKAQSVVRAFRIRADDFREVCATDVALAAALYERLARTLGRLMP